MHVFPAIFPVAFASVVISSVALCRFSRIFPRAACVWGGAVARVRCAPAGRNADGHTNGGLSADVKGHRSVMAFTYRGSIM